MSNDEYDQDGPRDIKTSSSVPELQTTTSARGSIDEPTVASPGPSWKDKTSSFLKKFKIGSGGSDATVETTRQLPMPGTTPDFGTSTMTSSPPPRGEASYGLRRRFDFLSLAEGVSQRLQNSGYAFYGKLVTVVLCSYFLADVLALIAGGYIPESSTAKSARGAGAARHVRGMDDYNMVFTRNLFNRKGLIPGEDTGGDTLNPGGAPVRTTLPFDLVGTLIMRDETRSIATIEDKAATMVYPVRVDEEIPAKAKIVKIESRKVIFINKQANRLEFVDLPEDPMTTAKVAVNTPKAPESSKPAAASSTSTATKSTTR